MFGCLLRFWFHSAFLLSQLGKAWSPTNGLGTLDIFHASEGIMRSVRGRIRKACEQTPRRLAFEVWHVTAEGRKEGDARMFLFAFCIFRWEEEPLRTRSRV